jgi:YbgC/YbaW family acyl-CoA thioester hydrolase
MDRARTEWLRREGWSIARLADELGVLFVVGEVRVRYRAPARHDDELRVGVGVQALKSATLELVQPVCRGDAQVICEGWIRLVSVSADSFRPRPFPEILHKVLAP